MGATLVDGLQAASAHNRLPRRQATPWEDMGGGGGHDHLGADLGWIGAAVPLARHDTGGGFTTGAGETGRGLALPGRRGAVGRGVALAATASDGVLRPAETRATIGMLATDRADRSTGAGITRSQSE
jgi:hypothetical protein